MTLISILLTITILVAAVQQYRYPRSGHWRDHVVLVAAACTADFMLMLAFASSGDYETWAWIAAGSVFLAAIAGNVILLVGSRYVAVRPGPYYVATTLAVAAAVCCAAIDKSAQLRTNADVLADCAPFAVGAVLLVVAAIVMILVARPSVRGLVAGKAIHIGCAALAAAVGLIAASLIVNLGDGLSGLTLKTPLNHYDQNLSAPIAVLTVLGITLIFRRRGRPGRMASIEVAILPALIVLVGLDAGVAVALLAGLLLALNHGPRRANSAIPYVLLGVAAICTAIAVSPSASAAAEHYWTSLADAENGGRAYEAIMLFAAAGPGIELGGQGLDFGLGSEYGSLPLLANFLGMPAFIALAFMCIASVLGCWAGRKRFGRPVHTPALPVGVTLVGIAYVAALTGFGLAPGYVPFPFVSVVSEYATAGYVLAVGAVCLCGCGRPVVTRTSHGERSETAIVPIECPGARAGWKPFAVALPVTVLCCAGLCIGIGALKETRDEDALVEYALTCPDDVRSRFLEGNLLAEKVEGEPVAITSSLANPTRTSGEDGAMLRLVKRYKGGVDIEEDWRFIFPGGIVDIGRLWETPCHLVHADALPAVGYPITDLLDESAFKDALLDVLVDCDGDSNVRINIRRGDEAVVERALVDISDSAELDHFELKRTGSCLSEAYGTCALKTDTDPLNEVDFEFRVGWDGSSLNVSWLSAAVPDTVKDH